MYVFGSGQHRWRKMYQSCWNRGELDGRVSVIRLRWCGWCRWGVGKWLGSGYVGVGGVMSV